MPGPRFTDKQNRGEMAMEGLIQAGDIECGAREVPRTSPYRQVREVEVTSPTRWKDG